MGARLCRLIDRETDGRAYDGVGPRIWAGKYSTLSP